MKNKRKQQANNLHLNIQTSHNNTQRERERVKERLPNGHIIKMALQSLTFYITYIYIKMYKR